MDINDSYIRISKYFNFWARKFELDARKQQIKDSENLNGKKLIISPPTDPVIDMLASQGDGSNLNLICFSEATTLIARKYLKKRKIKNVNLVSTKYFILPFGDDEIVSVYLNCFIDFCNMSEVPLLLAEINRTLRPKGKLFAVFMSFPKSIKAKVWTGLFRIFNSFTGGCHPVEDGLVSQNNIFNVLENRYSETKGFPLRYMILEKP
ncbi:MAG: methyltransferase domain-containing protein [Ignavibacteria bacterium]|nr:MAG: methyltransferase domain-containing protein [Ignavibacteria bacterium]